MTNNDDSTSSTCYEVLDSTYSYEDNADKFVFACAEGSALTTGADGENVCVVDEEVISIYDYICPTSVTTRLSDGTSVTHTNIQTTPGVPNDCDEGEDEDGISRCVHPSSGIPYNGWETQPSCQIIMETTHSYCSTTEVLTSF